MLTKIKLESVSHSRKYDLIEAEGVDRAASFIWLKSEVLFRKTEELIMAIQDQIISTSNDKKYI